MDTRQTPEKNLLAALLLLVVFGWIMAFSASVGFAAKLGTPYGFFIKHSFFIVLSIFAGLIILKTPVRFLQQYTFTFFVINLILLALVFAPVIGYGVKGSHRWLDLIFLKFQPSEMMKLVMVLFMAKFLSHERKNDAQNDWVGFLKFLLILAAVAALLLFETDIGATVVISLTALLMLFAAGAFLKQLMVVGGGVLLLIATLVFFMPNRLGRITAIYSGDFWLVDHPQTYQLKQALLAIASGEWFGVGLGAGLQKLSRLPDAHTDFIFAVIGEELGIVGMSVVIFLFTYIIVKGWMIAAAALRQNRKYSAYVAFGICCWLMIQVSMNLGVNVGLLPTKGITLPLVSYGGSSLIFTTVALAILLRIDMENRSDYLRRKVYV